MMFLLLVCCQSKTGEVSTFPVFGFAGEEGKIVSAFDLKGNDRPVILAMQTFFM